MSVLFLKEGFIEIKTVILKAEASLILEIICENIPKIMTKDS